jgi:general secretion pathway protein G
MVVIVIIGLLATLVVPNVVSKLAKANTTKARADIVQIAKAVEDYMINNNGRFPDSLQALVTEDDKGESYLQQTQVPKDPWGNEYGYEAPPSGSRKYRVYSLGKDGAPGGEGDDADIDNVMIRDGN